MNPSSFKIARKAEYPLLYLREEEVGGQGGGGLLGWKLGVVVWRGRTVEIFRGLDGPPTTPVLVTIGPELLLMGALVPPDLKSPRFCVCSCKTKASTRVRRLYKQITPSNNLTFVLTTSSGVVKLAATAPAPHPLTILVNKLKSPLGLITCDEHSESHED